MIGAPLNPIAGNVIAGRHGLLSSDDLHRLTDHLRPALQARFATTPVEDLDDAMAEVIASFFTAPKPVPRQPLAYLLVSIGNEVLRSTNNSSETNPIDSDDHDWPDASDVDDLLASLVALDELIALMKLLRAMGLDDLAHFVRVWLALDWAGERPSTRRVGDELGVSHTEVRRSLVELRPLIERLREG